MTLGITVRLKHVTAFHLPSWRKKMLLLVCAEQSKVSTFLRNAYAMFADSSITENNLFLVKRLLNRTDMRNPDPATRRYTSLAWAAALGHEETFEFLLTAGHDDEELSKVRVSYF
jgi:hypothetical protein